MVYMVASWTGRNVHPLMQFERIAGLSEDPRKTCTKTRRGVLIHSMGSIPERECRTLFEALRGFTSTPGCCCFCLWEGYGNIDTRLYRAGSRVRGQGRDYLLFRGPIDAIMAFLAGDGPFWRESPNIWWPEDRAWCVATDIDLYDTYIGGSQECIEAVLSNPGPRGAPHDSRRSAGAAWRHHQRAVGGVDGCSKRLGLTPLSTCPLMGRGIVSDVMSSSKARTNPIFWKYGETNPEHRRSGAVFATD